MIRPMLSLTLLIKFSLQRYGLNSLVYISRMMMRYAFVRFANVNGNVTENEGGPLILSVNTK